jgi:hypothetical protein
VTYLLVPLALRPRPALLARIAPSLGQKEILLVSPADGATDDDAGGGDVEYGYAAADDEMRAGELRGDGGLD